MMKLAVVDHLHAVLDRPQDGIGVGQRNALVGADPARRGEPRQRIARRRRPQRRIAAAMDQLVDLREELDLANAAAPALEVEAGAERLPLRMMVANAPRDAANLADRAEIERAAPDERPDRLEKCVAQRGVATCLACLDEGRALPGKRERLIIGNGCLDRQRDRRRLG